MSITIEAVKAALSQVVDPNTGKDLNASKSAKNIPLDGADVSLDVELGYPAKSQIDGIRKAVIAAVRKVDGVGNVSVNVYSKIIAHSVQRGVKLLSNVKNVIAVASGKGGVGKSTTAVNLALALAAEGAQVGILDADIYGPSQPMMMGISGRPETVDGKTMEPMENYGLQVSSIGFMIDPDEPMVWRGPIVTQALQQLLEQTNWRDLDYLIVDMPPGTGDIQLENMSVHICSNCGHAEPIFGEGGGAKMCSDYGVDFLGALPLTMSIREQADSGRPTVVADPDGPVAKIYKEIARKIAVKVAEKAKDMTSKFPNIVIKND
jgi:ATP-binding protein involved in chromosome partitioning